MLRKAVLWIIATVLLGYGLYTLWLVTVYGSYWFLLWTVPCFVGAAGLVLSKPWARYFIYLVAFCTAAGWAGYVSILAVQGWPYSGLQRTAAALLPGVLLVIFCAGCCAFVHRHFNPNDRQI